MPNTFEQDFEARASRQTWQAKSWRFARYLSTRKVECWGFFIAGLMIGGIFL